MNKELILAKFKRNLDYHFSKYLNEPLISPHWIYISLTHQCNNDCLMCGVKNILKDHQLSNKTIKKLLDEISSFRSGQTVLFTGGEPFLREDIFDLIEYSLKVGNETELVSNGSLINEEIAEKVINSQLSNIAISFDGATAATHDQIRGRQGSFAEAKSAISNLVKFKKQRGFGPQISMWTTIMEHNLDELTFVADLALELGVECLVYHPVIVCQEDMQRTKQQGSMWISCERLGDLKKQIAKLITFKEEHGLIAFLHDPYLFVDYFQGTLTNKDWKCNPFEFLSVGPDGNVSSCGRAFGNIHDLSLKETLATADAYKARQVMKKCLKPCLQTCWARPEAEELAAIVDVFIKDTLASCDKLAVVELEKQAYQLLDTYQKMLK